MPTKRTEQKLRWDKVSGCFDLKLVDYKQIDVNQLAELLRNVECPDPEYNKAFNKYASQLLNQWFDDPSQPLREAAYALLSNWFLTGCSASKSNRAEHAAKLWDALFCSRPERRITDWRISGSRVIPYEFDQWWKKQLKCQKDC